MVRTRTINLHDNTDKDKRTRVICLQPSLHNTKNICNEGYKHKNRRINLANPSNIDKNIIIKIQNDTNNKSTIDWETNDVWESHIDWEIDDVWESHIDWETNDVCKSQIDWHNNDVWEINTKISYDIKLDTNTIWHKKKGHIPALDKNDNLYEKKIINKNQSKPTYSIKCNKYIEIIPLNRIAITNKTSFYEIYDICLSN